MQDSDIFYKNRKSTYERKLYNMSSLNYQGTYELDFINRYFDKYIIENGITINYNFMNINSKYYSDFYLPEFNLIVEIKSSWTLNIDKNRNIQKMLESVKCGYNYITIVDKNYDEFNLYVRNY